MFTVYRLHWLQLCLAVHISVMFVWYSFPTTIISLNKKIISSILLIILLEGLYVCRIYNVYCICDCVSIKNNSQLILIQFNCFKRQRTWLHLHLIHLYLCMNDDNNHFLLLALTTENSWANCIFIGLMIMDSDFGIIEMDFVVLVVYKKKWIWNMEKSLANWKYNIMKRIHFGIRGKCEWANICINWTNKFQFEELSLSISS